MMLLSEPLTEVLFKRGEFDAQDVEQTAATVLAYGTAIWAFLGVTVLQRVFFALEDSTTPVRAGLLTVGLNFVLNFVLLFMIGGSGLAYATSFASMVQFLLLIYLLRFRIALEFDHGFWQFLGKLALATTVMSLLCWISDHCLTSQKLLPLWASRLTGPIIVSVLCYFVCLKLMGVQELSLLTGHQRPATGTGDDDNSPQ